MNETRLTSLSHGGGCGCKIAPSVLSEILKGVPQLPFLKRLFPRGMCHRSNE
jgi:selenide,water dikinase